MEDRSRALSQLRLQLLPGQKATRAWWNACARGQIGVVERAVAQARTRHARAMQALERQCDGGNGSEASMRLRLLYQIDTVRELLEMTQPSEREVGGNSGQEPPDPYADAEASGGGTALHVATANGHVEIVSFLLSLGAPVDRYDANGRNPLHLACTQGWADLVKLLLLHCPTRRSQIQLLKQVDCRGMCCRQMCIVARKDWQAAGISAHTSGSFLRRKIGTQLILPGLRWWKNRRDRRRRRRRRGAGAGGDSAGARDFDRTRDLITLPPPPRNADNKASSLLGYQSRFFGQNQSSSPFSNSSKLSARMQRRTRSPLISLSNEVIWRTALEYNEDEELQLGNAAAHAPELKLRLEAIKTVEMAKRVLSVLRPALALGLHRKKRVWGDRRGGVRRRANASSSDDNSLNLDPEQLALGLRAESNGTSMDNPAETIESVIWLQRIRARMRIDRAISKYSNADSSGIRERSRMLLSVNMGVGIVPAWQSRSLAPRRRERASLVEFQPAAEFTKQELIRQQRMRQAKINGPTNLELEGNNDDSAPSPPPPLAPGTSESKKAVNEVNIDELNDDGTPKTREAPSIIPTTKTSAEQSSAKRLNEAREMAKKEEARKKLREQKMKERFEKEAAQAKAREEALLVAQRQEREQTKRMNREKKKREQAAKRERKKKAKEERKESSARKKKFQKNRFVANENRKGRSGDSASESGMARRYVDRGYSAKDADDEKKEEERRNRARAELEARMEDARRRERIKEEERRREQKLAEEEEKRQTWLSLQKVMSTLRASDCGWAGYNRTEEQIAARKREIAKRRGENRVQTAKSLLGEDEYNSLASMTKKGEFVDPCRPPDDEDSVMDRKYTKEQGRYNKVGTALMQKNAEALLKNAEGGGESPGTLLSDPRASIPWKLSSAFDRTGYAHRKGRFRLKPLEVWG
eukprot:g4349.t1